MRGNRPFVDVPVNREDWLTLAVGEVRPLFTKAELVIPKVRVSCGWPASRGTAAKNRRIGECWPTKLAVDGTIQIFISPMLDNPINVGATLVHELVHAALDCKHGHKGPFKRAAYAVGLAGKATATVAGPELAEYLAGVVTELGPYPNGALLAPSKEKKQSTRLLKVFCPMCDYTARITRKWIEVGLPTCPCGETMVLDGEGEDE